MAWAGQSDAVSRLLFGWDLFLKSSIEANLKKVIDDLHDAMSGRSAQILADALSALGQGLPDGVDLSLPGKPTLNLPWDDFHFDVAFGNLPLQDAIDFAAYLVNLQSGKAKFSHSVATVGGRTHIGFVTKEHRFRLLNEPELTHRYTGLSHDA